MREVVVSSLTASQGPALEICKGAARSHEVVVTSRSWWPALKYAKGRLGSREAVVTSRPLVTRSKYAKGRLGVASSAPLHSPQWARLENKGVTSDGTGVLEKIVVLTSDGNCVKWRVVVESY